MFTLCLLVKKIGSKSFVCYQESDVQEMVVNIETGLPKKLCNNNNNNINTLSINNVKFMINTYKDSIATILKLNP